MRGHLLQSIEKYKKRFGFYPYEVLADQIYCTRENRKLLKEKNIKLVAKPLGRPSATAVKNHMCVQIRWMCPMGDSPIKAKVNSLVAKQQV